MKLTTFISSLALLASVTASTLRPIGDVIKRDPSGSFSLYNHGVSSRALKLFYADGLSLLLNPLFLSNETNR